MEVCWPPTCTCMRMQVVKSPVHMPSVTAKRWGGGGGVLSCWPLICTCMYEDAGCEVICPHA